LSTILSLDPYSLLVVNASNVLLLAATLLFVMGRQLSAGASGARNTLSVQALAWIALLLSNLWPERLWFNWLLATLAMGAFSLSNWFLFQALAAWLGQRPGRRALLVLVVLAPLGYAVLFGCYPLRIAWSNMLLAAQFAILARATLFPQTKVVGRWRWALSLCTVVMALLSSGRAILGGFFPELYPYFMAPHPFNLAYLLLTNLTLILTNVSLLVGWRDEAEQQLRDQAITDPLTTVLNRRGWNEAAGRVFAQAQRHRLPLALLLLDLDHFKQINDSRGHEAGDAALRFFGQLLRQEQRAGDVVARIGGEEFYILMPMADESAARGFDQRLRAIVAASAAAELGQALDFSAGLCCFENGDDCLETLESRADKALYQAKSAGRGRLVKALAD
jgi:diguanylate cyclase (GGDEF)-like protein